MRETNRGFLNYAFKGRGEKIPMRIFLNLELSRLLTMCITRTCYAYFQICDIFWLTALDPRFKSLKVVENKKARDSIFKKLEQYLKEKEVEKNPENWPPNEIYDSNASRNMKIRKNNF